MADFSFGDLREGDRLRRKADDTTWVVRGQGKNFLEDNVVRVRIDMEGPKHSSYIVYAPLNHVYDCEFELLPADPQRQAKEQLPRLPERNETYRDTRDGSVWVVNRCSVEATRCDTRTRYNQSIDLQWFNKSFRRVQKHHQMQETWVEV